MKGAIKPQEATLAGKISLDGANLAGAIQAPIILSGRVAIPAGYKYFGGNYEIMPKIESQILDTKDKLMSKDVFIKSIPYYEVSNLQGGTTIIIGGE